MRRDDAIRLRHMLDAVREARGFTATRSRPDLDLDRMFLLALVKDIEIIGEAASRVSAEARAQLPDIPWQDIVAMRHRLIHGYFDIDLDIVWSTVTDDLSGLAAHLERALESVASFPENVPDPSASRAG
jgi:uncharacterized protein with HEPN domain